MFLANTWTKNKGPFIRLHCFYSPRHGSVSEFVAFLGGRYLVLYLRLAGLRVWRTPRAAFRGPVRQFSQNFSWRG